MSEELTRLRVANAVMDADVVRLERIIELVSQEGEIEQVGKIQEVHDEIMSDKASSPVAVAVAAIALDSSMTETIWTGRDGVVAGADVMGALGGGRLGLAAGVAGAWADGWLIAATVAGVIIGGAIASIAVAIPEK